MSLSRRSFVRTGLGVAAAVQCGPLAFAADAKPGMAGIAASADHIRQQIDGFGFCEAFHAAGMLQNFPEKERTALLDLMFSMNGGMGYSILRNQIGNGPKDSRPGQVASIEPEKGTYNWDGDADQVWLTGEAKKRGCTRVLASSWSPPDWMKTNKNEWGGELKPECYQDFADYLATYVLEYKKRFDIEIYAISPQNEPNFTPTIKYASCRWTSAQMVKFLKQNLIPTFAAKGVTAKIVVDEHEHWTDEGINDILSDSACAKGVDIVAAHAYAPTNAPYVSLDSRTKQFPMAVDKKKAIWETEVSAGDAQITNMNDGVYWARVIHKHMIEDNVSAWLYWWGAMSSKSRSSLIVLDPETKTYSLTKRFFTIGHFARFIRPGFHRVDASPQPAQNTYFSAYLSPDGKQLVCVAINDDAVERPITIFAGGFSGKTCNSVRTSGTETHKRLPVVTMGANGGFDVTTTPLSVTTFVITA